MDTIVTDRPRGVALVTECRRVMWTRDPPPNGPIANPRLTKCCAVPNMFLQIDKPARLAQLSAPPVSSLPAPSSDGGEHV